MRTTLPSRAELRAMVRELESAVDRGADEARAWLVSDQGRRYRAFIAGGLAVAAPVILKHPIFRTPLGRVVQLAGGAALVTRVAELIRDWEPATAHDVPRSYPTAHDVPRS